MAAMSIYGKNHLPQNQGNFEAERYIASGSQGLPSLFFFVVFFVFFFCFFFFFFFFCCCFLGFFLYFFFFFFFFLVFVWFFFFFFFFFFFKRGKVKFAMPAFVRGNIEKSLSQNILKFNGQN